MGSDRIKVYAGPYAMVTSAGLTAGQNFRSALAGRSGCLFYPGKGFPLGLADRSILRDEPATDTFTFLERMFIHTVGDVCRRSGVSLTRGDTLLILSSTKGNIELLSAEGAVDRRVYLWNMANRIGKYFECINEPLVVSNACISGLSAVIVASRLIRAGKYRHVIVAGGDTVTDFVLSGFASFKSLSGQVCRPYDAERDGLMLGEGCGAIVLSADIFPDDPTGIEIAGGAVSNDANHISGPSRTGEGLYLAIGNALCESGLDASQVDFVNGHGTATLYNDEMESKAFALAGLQEKPLNSLKPFFGHTLGACGVIEMIMCIEQIRHHTVLGIPGYRTGGTSVPLNVSARNRAATLNTCVKTASGFGGCNAAVVLAKTGYLPALPSVRKRAVRITGKAAVKNEGDDFAGFIRERYKTLGDPYMKFYKMDDLCKLGYVAAAELLKDTGLEEKYPPGRVGMVLYGNSSSLDSDRKHLRIMKASPAEGPSPAVFVYTLSNIVAGEIAIRHRMKGENTCFIFSGSDHGFTELYARLLIENGYLDAVLFGRCDMAGGHGTARLELLETTNNKEEYIDGETDA